MAELLLFPFLRLTLFSLDSVVPHPARLFSNLQRAHIV